MMHVILDGYEISEMVLNTSLTESEIVLILESIILKDMDWEITSSSLVRAIKNNYEGAELTALKLRISEL